MFILLLNGKIPPLEKDRIVSRQQKDSNFNTMVVKVVEFGTHAAKFDY